MFSGVRRERVDLCELELEQVQLALALRGELAELLQALLRRAHARELSRAQIEALALRGAGEIVEDLQLGGLERQLAVLMLSVEGEQRARDVTQIGERGRAAVEVGPRAPV